MRHIISILIENEAGALSCVAGLFSARGYNIESLTVAPTEDATLSRAETAHVERELLLVKIKTNKETQEEIKRLSDIFRGQIIDVTSNSYVIEMTGPSDKLDAFIAALDESSIIETVRSGPTGMSRGEHGLHL